MVNDPSLFKRKTSFAPLSDSTVELLFRENPATRLNYLYKTSLISQPIITSEIQRSITVNIIAFQGTEKKLTKKLSK